MRKAERARASYGNMNLAHRRPQRDLNPCFQLEGLESFTGLDDGDQRDLFRRVLRIPLPVPPPVSPISLVPVPSMMVTLLRKEPAADILEPSPKNPAEPPQQPPERAPEPEPEPPHCLLGLSAKPRKNSGSARTEDANRLKGDKHREKRPNQIHKRGMHTLPPVAFRRVGFEILYTVHSQRKPGLGPAARQLVQADAKLNFHRPRASQKVEGLATDLARDLNQGNVVISDHSSLPSFQFLITIKYTIEKHFCQD